MSKIFGNLILVLAALTVVGLLVVMVQEARADHHEYYGGFPGGTHRGSGDPYHYSDVQNPPQFTIHRDGRRGRGYGSDPYHYSDVQNPPQFTIYRDRRR